MKHLRTPERPAATRGETGERLSTRATEDDTTPRGYPLDERGLHPEDSGFVYATRAYFPAGEVKSGGTIRTEARTRIKWWKHPAEARQAAKLLSAADRRVTIERYEIANRRVVEVVEAEPMTAGGGSDG